MRPYYGRMESETSDERDAAFDNDGWDGYLEEDDVPPTYVVKTIAYCGMVFPHGEFEDYDDALKRVQSRIEWLKKQGSETERVGVDEWEVGEPEGCMMVPDFCGTLVIREVFK